ncbi:hypothetical protein C8Q78DRAFT_1011621 [Trametes maxima]|nr:hypothetical protein C8Q78DRAFT_1011621 [Trametes maxima]
MLNLHFCDSTHASPPARLGRDKIMPARYFPPLCIRPERHLRPEVLHGGCLHHRASPRALYLLTIGNRPLSGGPHCQCLSATQAIGGAIQMGILLILATFETQPSILVTYYVYRRQPPHFRIVSCRTVRPLACIRETQSCEQSSVLLPRLMIYGGPRPVWTTAAVRASRLTGQGVSLRLPVSMATSTRTASPIAIHCTDQSPGCTS